MSKKRAVEPNEMIILPFGDEIPFKVLEQYAAELDLAFQMEKKDGRWEITRYCTSTKAAAEREVVE